MDEPVERREEASCVAARACRPRRGCASSRPRSSLTPSARKRFSSKTRLASRQGTVSVSGYQRSARSQTRCFPRRPATATSPRDVQHAEHQSHLPLAPPPVRLALRRRVIRDLAREQRARAAPARGGRSGGSEAFSFRNAINAQVERPVAAAHPRPQKRQILGRPDERVPFDELSLLPDQPVELFAVVRPEPAPEHEVLRRRDRRDRVDLEEPEPAHGVEHRRSPSRRAAGPQRDAAGLLRCDRPHLATVSRSSTRASRSSALSSAVSSAPERLTLGSRCTRLHAQHAVAPGRTSGRPARRAGRRTRNGST